MSAPTLKWPQDVADSMIYCVDTTNLSQIDGKVKIQNQIPPTLYCGVQSFNLPVFFGNHTRNA